MTTITSSPFGTLEATFGLLTAEPTTLRFDGAPFAPGLPARTIPFGELRDRLLLPSTPFGVRDAVIAQLTHAAADDEGGGGALVVLAGMLLPGLRRAIAPFLRGCPGRRDDLEAEALTGLIDAVRGWDGNPRRLAARLIGRARDQARRLFTVETARWCRHADALLSAAPPRPWGHPDLVLARAVAEGVLGPADAELIGETRLGDRTLRSYAADVGIGEDAAWRRRTAAERRVVAWLRS